MKKNDILVKVKERMLPGEHLFAYLDDVYVLCKPDRVKVLYELLKSILKEDRVRGLINDFAQLIMTSRDTKIPVHAITSFLASLQKCQSFQTHVD